MSEWVCVCVYMYEYTMCILYTCTRMYMYMYIATLNASVEVKLVENCSYSAGMRKGLAGQTNLHVDMHSSYRDQQAQLQGN